MNSLKRRKLWAVKAICQSTSTSATRYDSKPVAISALHLRSCHGSCRLGKWSSLPIICLIDGVYLLLGRKSKSQWTRPNAVICSQCNWYHRVMSPEKIAFEKKYCLFRTGTAFGSGKIWCVVNLLNGRTNPQKDFDVVLYVTCGTGVGLTSSCLVCQDMMLPGGGFCCFYFCGNETKVGFPFFVTENLCVIEVGFDFFEVSSLFQEQEHYLNSYHTTKWKTKEEIIIR